MQFMVRLMLKTSSGKTTYGRTIVDTSDQISAKREAEANYSWKYPKGCKAVIAEDLKRRNVQPYRVRILWKEGSQSRWAEVVVRAYDPVSAKESAIADYAWKYPDLTASGAMKA